MPENKMMPVNEFVARGVVLAIGRNNRYRRPMVRIVIKGRRDTAYIECQIEGDYPNDIHRRDYVMVQGYIRAFTYHNDALNKNSDVFYFVCTKIQKDKPELEQRFGVRGGNFHAEQFFRAYVSGTVEKIRQYPDSSWAHITVNTRGGEIDRRPSHVVMSYPLNSRLPLFDYEVGDKICARCSVYTPEKKTNGKSMRFQNLTVEDIAYLEKKNRPEDGIVPNPFPDNIPGGQNSRPADDDDFDDARYYGAGFDDDYADDSALMDN